MPIVASFEEDKIPERLTNHRKSSVSINGPLGEEEEEAKMEGEEDANTESPTALVSMFE